MTAAFKACSSPDAEILGALCELTPKSPFNTPAYASAIRLGRGTPSALLLTDADGRIIGGCLAVLVGGRWRRKLEISTAPALVEPLVFWAGVAAYCREQKVYELDIQTFAASTPSLPDYPFKRLARRRSEFVMDLSDSTLSQRFSKNHKRSINKAKKAGITILQSRELGDYQNHVTMMQASMVRRSKRGENIKMPSAQDFDFALLQCGAGTLYQAKLGDEVVASILILLSEAAGYYHTAGTLPVGMQLGASPYLISQVAQHLAHDGRSSLNLGGVDPDATGLRRFKSGFAAEEISLSAEKYTLMSPGNIFARRILQKLVG